MSTLPFKAPTVPAGTVLVGQPFTITECWLPVNLTLTCNCGGRHNDAPPVVAIVNSKAEQCPCCAKTYNPRFNVMTSQLEMLITPAEKVPS
jgi:hypothetical protein